MSGTEDPLLLAVELSQQGEAYAMATVVRVLRPASARRADRALVTPDGTLHGWIGGACSEPLVVREALRALADGEPRLVRIGPPGSAPEAPADVVVAESTCASEGTVEVLVEPHLPTPLLAVAGDSPASRTLAELARAIGWRVSTGVAAEADAVVVAAMGQGDELGALEAALRGRAGYVGLVASARRAGAVVAELRARGLDDDAVARLRSPAGLDLGPCTQEEIAVAILAELVPWRHAGGAARPGRAAEAVDPVCGMTVAVQAAKATALHEGTVYRFCSPDCRARFVAEPGRYLIGGEPETAPPRTPPSGT
jgi:xanthine dehydrogenase accessory factor